ncbi:hypothetical protein MTDSW087_04585 [Methylobacterium dankookense]|uniref:Uncharacterized protein n=2 Tax=Methylobacterium dankookense TaxID=560405 RepID=A0A564G2X7_9HYPH|nr:hypothetical protein IFDJLNFL_2790 [Methylobacterium dankookense]VUF14859.1 hypothetical protein MTDSW087_04585 [Methylobacterium dankookense]
MTSMNAHAFSRFHGGRPEPLGEAAPPVPAPAPGWSLMPLSGRFELVYEDGQGVWSRRTVEARELKLGPGRTLLGGIDPGRGGYRGFRTDRIRRLTDAATGERLEGGILDWLMARAEAQRRADAARIRRNARARRRAALAEVA